ncbi:hornerin-like isoform X2 [Hyposmocoma kahamanoa]|uniref:hornerin-like isoform X2 n=1 Tax=Hyposmocoma kahamanoa TaxID=1477025 RepID=UPI000E6D8BD3|nr:hornerin-like isoform X2 [Hyposmocoma kahamanoa]
MNLIIIAAFIAVCGAAKLDRTYLPPASAKTAGGSPGSLQTPLQNSLGNNGLGGLPKGSFTNDFEGVVVDAAAAGTRASGSEDTGLGAPRLSYGSINSKVGAAGFKTNENAFNNDGQSTNNQRFQSAQGSNFQTGGAERPRAALDRAANTLRFENEVGPESYSYAFETDNGITAEENGVATNGVQAQGGFSYTGDDGQVYSVSYTADEGGYQPKGDHLPTPPPIPEEILRSLEQNARDEAAGLIDDGSYDAQKYNAGSDYSESNNAQGKFSHQSFKFGQVDATGSGSFISQSNQPFRPGVKAQEKTRHQGFSGQVGHSQGQGHESLEHGESPNRAFGTDGFEEQKSNEDRIGATSNRFGSGSSSGQTGFGSKQPQAANRFSQSSSSRFEASNPNRQIGQSGFASAQSQTNGFGSSASAQSSQGFGNRNEYLPPTNGFSRPQNGRPQSSRPQVDSSPDSTMQFIQEVNTNEENTDNFVALSQQKLQEQKQPLGTTSTSYNQPISGISGQSNFGTNVISSQNPSSNNGRLSNRFGQGGQSSQASASFGSRKEYLPPTTGSNQNRFLNQPSASSGMGSQFNQQSSQSDTHSPSHQNRLSHSSTASSQSAFGSQQFNGFEKPQATSNEKQRLSTGSSPFSSAQSILDQKATAEPQTELTTPFESSADSSSAQSQTTTSDKVLFDSSPSNRRPSQTQFGNQFYPGLSASPTQPSSSALPSFGSQIGSGSVGQTQAPAFPTQATRGQFIQQSQFNQQSQGAQNNDAQYSASTQRPSINQQQQGSDDSYYYNQPSQPFNTPQSSRFPSVPSNQFNRVGQGAQSNPQLTNARQDVSAGPFVAQSGNYQGSSKYPRPPTVAPTAFTPASTQSQYQSSGFNGITQASISPFPSQAPTQSSQFNTETQFDSRPQTSNQFDQNSRKPLFGQQTTLTQSLFGSQSGPQSSKSQQSSLQNQAQGLNLANQPELHLDKPLQLKLHLVYSPQVLRDNLNRQSLLHHQDLPVNLKQRIRKIVMVPSLDLADHVVSHPYPTLVLSLCDRALGHNLQDQASGPNPLGPVLVLSPSLGRVSLVLKVRSLVLRALVLQQVALQGKEKSSMHQGNPLQPALTLKLVTIIKD